MMLPVTCNLLKRPFRSCNPAAAGPAVALRLGLAAVVVSSLFAVAPCALAVSCVTQSQMTGAERADLAGAVSRLSQDAAKGDTASLRAATLPSVAPQFGGIAATVESLAPALRNASLITENLYLLHATDLKADDEAQFFCSAPGSPLLVTLSIPQLPPGNYAVALVHATGVAKPEQIGMILADGTPAGAPASPAGSTTAGPHAANWQLAGFFARPLTIADHDGDWYWTRARELAKAQQRWSAYYYYQSAQMLLTPVDFLLSPNLAKLQREEAAVRPDGVPTGDGGSVMTVAQGDQTFAITSLGTDGALGGLDLVVHYNANAGSVDPVFARSQAIQLMKTLLDQHPELRANFHGLWVYADSPGHQPFAVELPMQQIQ